MKEVQRSGSAKEYSEQQGAHRARPVPLTGGHAWAAGTDGIRDIMQSFAVATMPARMPDDNQILIPPSFLALYTDRHRRPTATLDTLRGRYDLCEDLANHLVDLAKGVHHDLGVSEDEVLVRCRRGLLAPPAQVTVAEADWIERRLAELLGWP